MSNITRLRTVLLACCLLATSSRFSAGEEVAANWEGTRPWIGPGFFANPLQDFELKQGLLHARSEQAGFVTWMNLELVDKGDAILETTIQLTSKGSGKSLEQHRAGFRIGVKGLIDDWRTRSVYPSAYLFCGVNASGQLCVGESASQEKVDLSNPVALRVLVKSASEQGKAIVRLSAVARDGKPVEFESTVNEVQVEGGVSIFAGKTGERLPIGSDAPYWSITSPKASGERVISRADRSFGPIFWSQYTLSRGILKLSVQLPPLGEASSEPVRLEEQRGGEWIELARESIETRSCTALFRIADWNDRRDHELRVSFLFQGVEYSWPCKVRKDPKDQESVSVAVITCDNGYAFPQPHAISNLLIQNPDVLFYAGDQIYEAETGKFGVIRTPEDDVRAVHDYLRKWFIFGWQHRELMRDRPAVCIPDDHDHFQGNLFGNGGVEQPLGTRSEYGGFIMHPNWVNMMQRTQTGNLPDPVDPEPIGKGIGVYFTDMVYGNLHFAILQDRTWKPGPDRIWKSKNNPDGPPLPSVSDPKAYDLPGLELFGPRQEAFLERWAASREGDFHVALSQNPLCQASTNIGWKLQDAECDFDSNSWPQTARNRAVRIFGKANAITLHGDQHFGLLARLGADTWDDGPISFMPPGLANGFPRAWWPDHPGEDRAPGSAENTGKYIDSFGNRMNILLAANPDPSTNT